MGTAGRRVRVLIGDAHEVRRAALGRSVAAVGGTVLGAVGCGRELLRLALRHRPDVVVVDPRISGERAATLLSGLLEGLPHVQVVSAEPAARPEGPVERLHVAGDLDPGDVEAVLRRLVTGGQAPVPTAVVCLADPSFR